MPWTVLQAKNHQGAKHQELWSWEAQAHNRRFSWQAVIPPIKAIEQQLPASLKSWVTKGSKFPESKEAWEMANKTFLCYIMKHQELGVRSCRDGSALADLAEDQGLIPNTHMVAHNCLQPSFFLFGPLHTWYIDMYANKMHTHNTHSTRMEYRYTYKWNTHTQTNF